MSLMTLSRCSVDSEASAAYSPCSSVMLGGFQQLQHAQHAIHRRAQFVAHHRQEVGFGAVGLLRFLAGLDQLGHGLLLFAAGLFQAPRQVVDVSRQVAQFGVVDNRAAAF